MVTQHMLARPSVRHEVLTSAREITLRSRELARREERERRIVPTRSEPALRRPARARRAWAWARALSV